MDKIIGIGEYTISNDINDVIKTYALSSCVALTAYDPIKNVLGMVHIALPNSGIMQNGVVENPAYYADTALPLLINKMCIGYGCIKAELEIRLFGGADSVRKDDVFNIGKRNLKMIESILQQMKLKSCYSDSGGHLSRSIKADVATGTVKVVFQPLNV